MKIKVEAEIFPSETTMNIPDEEIEGMTEGEKSDYVYENYINHWVDENTSAGYKEIDA
jgi:hypothetical protein